MRGRHAAPASDDGARPEPRELLHERQAGTRLKPNARRSPSCSLASPSHARNERNSEAVVDGSDIVAIDPLGAG